MSPTAQERFDALPQSLRNASKVMRLGDDVPALVAHPDWETPTPTVVWMHGRTAHKELDPGRYLRWLRAGIATVSLDLPGHGERFERDAHGPARTVEVVSQMHGEIDGVLRAIPDVGPFDMDRLAIGGMSAGGMATLRRLCDPHPFKCAAVECTSGDLATLYFDSGVSWSVEHDREKVATIDPMEHLDGFAPLPLLVLHNELDALTPIGAQRGFVRALRALFAEREANPDLVEFRVFPETGAPSEHAGFGRHANEAKALQTAFLARNLGLSAVPASPDNPASRSE
ncbi:MAG: prolyl oligopeptidase family serine peptidase [Phycisphaerales bacterium]